MTPDSYKYIGVDEGWYLIVADCDRDLTAINPDYQILQIKEKFGGLRYYIKPVNATTKEVKDMKDQAQAGASQASVAKASISAMKNS